MPLLHAHLSHTHTPQIQYLSPQVMPRPRIPVMEQVDPGRPYHQCTNCTFATHSVELMHEHVNTLHFAETRYVCPLCLHPSYFKNASGT